MSSGALQKVCTLLFTLIPITAGTSDRNSLSPYSCFHPYLSFRRSSTWCQARISYVCLASFFMGPDHMHIRLIWPSLCVWFLTTLFGLYCSDHRGHFVSISVLDLSTTIAIYTAHSLDYLYMIHGDESVNSCGLIK